MKGEHPIPLRSEVCSRGVHSSVMIDFLGMVASVHLLCVDSRDFCCHSLSFDDIAWFDLDV